MSLYISNKNERQQVKKYNIGKEKYTPLFLIDIFLFPIRGYSEQKNKRKTTKYANRLPLPYSA